MELKFHLPDFAVHYRLNRVLVEMLRTEPELFHDGLSIASFYGTFMQSLWNGGRVMSGRCDKAYVKQVVRDFDRLGIPLRFTFTNPLITKEHLNDDFCNFVLRTADNGINGVIVVSPILEDYIRSKYPRYKITSSTCKRITDLDRLNGEVEKNYDIVVLDYDFNNRYDVLEKVENKEKCEILVNACCQPNCPNRSEHYRQLGKLQIAICEQIKKDPKHVPDTSDYKLDRSLSNCPFMDYDAVDVRKHRTHITPEDIINKYVPMGFRQFKIEGRTAELPDLVEHYMYYLVKPEYRDEARLELFKNLISNGVLTENY